MLTNARLCGVLANCADFAPKRSFFLLCLSSLWFFLFGAVSWLGRYGYAENQFFMDGVKDARHAVISTD